MLGSQVSTYGFIKIDKIWQGQRSFDFRGKLMITITAYNWVPDFAKGLVRDLRVRWALEEAGLPYQVKLITHEEKLTPSYRVLQPFSQVPSYRDDDVVLFESGAIILHIASTSDALLPTDHVGRARATAWVFAALNSVEPFIMASSMWIFSVGRRPGRRKVGLTRKRWSRNGFLIWRNVCAGAIGLKIASLRVT
jgi:glutathione S-transferase-like protein